MSELQGQLKNKDVTWSLGATLGVGLAAFLVPQLVAGIALAVVAESRGQTLEELIGGDNIAMSFVLTLAIAIIGTFILRLYIKKKDFFKRLGFRKTKWEDVGMGVPGYIVYFFMAFIVNAIFAAYFPELADQAQDTGFDNAMGIELVYAFMTLVILAPVFEELLFRGFVFRGLAKHTSFWPAAISTSALFGLAHGQLNVAIDTFLIGMVASWLVWKTNSLWPAILLHVIKNLVAYLFIFVFEVSV